MTEERIARLAGRIVMVTGASSGLGARFARIIASQGGKVIAAARRRDRLDTLVGEIAAAGGSAIAVSLDVTDEASVKAAFDHAEEAYGPVAGLVANAGMTTAGRAVDLDVADFDAVFAVNVRGVFLTARECAGRLQAAGTANTGRIVLISSITARMNTSGLLPYSASKAAVAHMGRLMAKEWARSGPSVSILAPGYIRSELAGDWFEGEGGKAQMARWPRRALLDEDALDEMLLYLLSEGSGAVTGAEFVIDDGQSL